MERTRVKKEKGRLGAVTVEFSGLEVSSMSWRSGGLQGLKVTDLAFYGRRAQRAPCPLLQLGACFVI